MILDRKLQRQILTALEDVYPDSLLVAALPGYSSDRVFMGNLFYLQEHGFIEGGDIRQPGQCRSMIDAQITKDGLDFLTDDGGLAEILGSFAVKIDRDDIVSAVKAGVAKSEMDEAAGAEMTAFFERTEVSPLKALLLGLLEAAASEGHELLTENLSGR